MDIKSKFIGFFQKIIGTKTIKSKEDLLQLDEQFSENMAEAEARTQNQAYEYRPTEFDEKIKAEVEPVAPSIKYDKLSNEVKMRLQSNFENFKSSVLENGNTLQEKSEGEDKDSPFICYAEVDPSGNIVSTIVTTNNSTSKTTKEADGSYSYEEYRKGKNGMQVLLNDKKHGSLYLTGKNITPQTVKMLKEFAVNMDNVIKEVPKIKLEDIEAYNEVLDSLGVRKDVNIEDRERFSRFGVGYREKDLCQGMDCIYDKSENFDLPLNIIIGAKSGDNFYATNYQRTADGKYIDSNSFKMVDGKPQYNLFTYEQIKEIAASREIEVDEFERFEDYKRNNPQTKQNDEIIPEAAKSIYEATVRQNQRAKEQVNSQDMGRVDPRMS